MKESTSRGWGEREDQLSETYLSPSEHFMIHYDSIGGNDAPSQVDLNNNSIPDYVEEVGIIADSTRYILTQVMGFEEEIPDQDGKYDIYIVDFNSDYGWNHYDKEESNGSSFLIIDNDYSENFYYTNGINAMRVTVAHEFFHAIQRSYQHKSIGAALAPDQDEDYGYFYEFTSMWVEDIIVPNGNDYLYFISSSVNEKKFFSNPEQKFSDTDGYSVALYGHYLSSIIEGVEDETNNTIIKKVWEKFKGSPNNPAIDPIEAFNEVLLDYNSSFIESWIDFCSRNFHNGQFSDMNNDIYYYIDQTSTVLDGLGIENTNLHKGYIHTDESIDTLSTLEDNNLLEFELDTLSIEMHSIVVDNPASISINYSDIPDFGKYIVTEEVVVKNISTLDFPLSLYSTDIIHFLYAGNNPNNITVSIDASYFAPTPDILSVSIVDNGVEIIWSASSGADDLTYNIYREQMDEEIFDKFEGIEDTSYIDMNIEPDTEYTYSISSSNSIGESELSDSISITTWPDDDDINKTRIISLYPNPIYRPGVSLLNMVIDYGANIQNVDFRIYNIHGREVLSKQLGARDKGREEEELGLFLSSQLSSGIYFIQLTCDNTVLKQKFTILK